MSQPLIEVVIPVHSLDRPIARAVESVVSGAVADEVAVLVVAHGLKAKDVQAKLAGFDAGQVRVLEYVDGVLSASGPSNFGLSRSVGRYVMRMDSDDWLEPGFARAYVDYLRAHVDTDVVVIPMRTSQGRYLPIPLPRWGRSRHLKPARDRLLYRTQPFALIARDLLMQAGFLYREGMTTGEDLAIGVWVWTHGTSIAMDRALPHYIYSSDESDRLTSRVYSFDEIVAPLDDLLAMPWMRALPPRVGTSFAIKYLRVTVFPVLRGLGEQSQWSAADTTRLKGVIKQLTHLAPGFTQRMTLAETKLVRSITNITATDDLIAAARAQTSAGWFGRNVSLNPFLIFGVDSSMRRPFEFAWVRLRQSFKI